jgi:arabinogalactan endo-1,4-beta-galactosidase
LSPSFLCSNRGTKATSSSHHWNRPDRQQQPDQWNQWFTEKQSRTRAFAERTKTVLVKGRVKKNNGVLTINSIEAELKKDGKEKK